MIISSSSIGTSASRRYQSTQSIYKEHTEWDNASGTSMTEISSENTQVDVSTVSTNGSLCSGLDLSTFSESSTESEETPSEMDKGNSSSGYNPKDLMERFQSNYIKPIPTISEKVKAIQEIQKETLNHLLQILFGKDAVKPASSSFQINRTTSAAEASANNIITQTADALGETLGTGGSHISFYYCAEKETTCFDSKGVVITADGRNISFNISVEMSRSFVEMSSEEINFGQPRLCDPLVINLNTNVASVSDQKFFFDIDADGTKEEVPMLGSDSGYLALDNNDDGCINDGSELFGTTSGNGFKDLLAYDQDGNGWIDEADSIFHKLKVWSMNADGTSTLIDLKEAGVGAIYLGYENTEFSLKDKNNQTNAVIQKTGIFLYEEGMTGTVQQLDLAV